METLGKFNRFLHEAGGREADADRVAEVFARELAEVTDGDLPTEAQPQWRDAVRFLRSPADRPVAEKAIAAIRSWPASRVAELVSRIRLIHTILEKHENERLEDEIRDKIRRHYL